MKEARIKSERDGIEVRYANSRQHAWPGCAKPLGKAGYWVGTQEHHIYLGRSYAPFGIDHYQELKEKNGA